MQKKSYRVQDGSHLILVLMCEFYVPSIKNGDRLRIVASRRHNSSGIVRITVKSQWARWRLKSPASRLFTQPAIQAQIKENI